MVARAWGERPSTEANADATLLEILLLFPPSAAFIEADLLRVHIPLASAGSAAGSAAGSVVCAA